MCIVCAANPQTEGSQLLPLATAQNGKYDQERKNDPFGPYFGLVYFSTAGGSEAPVSIVVSIGQRPYTPKSIWPQPT